MAFWGADIVNDTRGPSDLLWRTPCGAVRGLLQSDFASVGPYTAKGLHNCQHYGPMFLMATVSDTSSIHQYDIGNYLQAHAPGLL